MLKRVTEGKLLWRPRFRIYFRFAKTPPKIEYLGGDEAKGKHTSEEVRSLNQSRMI